MKASLYKFSIFTIFIGFVLASQIYANEFKVGFAELSITPELIDEWEDVNNLSLIHI